MSGQRATRYVAVSPSWVSFPTRQTGAEGPMLYVCSRTRRRDMSVWVILRPNPLRELPCSCTMMVSHTRSEGMAVILEVCARRAGCEASRLTPGLAANGVTSTLVIGTRASHEEGFLQ